MSQDPTQFLERIGASITSSLRRRYNVAPTQQVLTVITAPGGSRRAGEMRWGLIPHWSKDPKALKRSLINARSETVHERPAFRDAFRRRRCVIPADGFYEWKTIQGSPRKQPYRITLKTEEMFGFAGIWDRWVSPEGETTYSCTILTTTPNELVGRIHDRMPVVLAENQLSQWLDPRISDRAQLDGLMRPYPADAMQAYMVSTAVNSPRNDDPTIIHPVA